MYKSYETLFEKFNLSLIKNTPTSVDYGRNGETYFRVGKIDEFIWFSPDKDLLITTIDMVEDFLSELYELRKLVQKDSIHDKLYFQKLIYSYTENRLSYGTTIINALANSHVETLSQFLSAGMDKVKKFKGIGPKSADILTALYVNMHQCVDKEGVTQQDE